MLNISILSRKYGDCFVPNEGFQKNSVLPLEHGLADPQKQLSELQLNSLDELVEGGDPDPSDGKDHEEAVEVRVKADSDMSDGLRHPAVSDTGMKELLDQVFLHVIAEVEQLPISGEALMQRMRQSDPEHSQLNVSQTPYRTIDMFMKAMSRKGRVSLLDVDVVLPKEC